MKREISKEDLREAFKQSRQCKIFEKGMPPIYESFEDWFKEFEKKDSVIDNRYSEEEVRALLIKALTHNDYNFCGPLVTAQDEIRPANFGVWFEENKKK